MNKYIKKNRNFVIIFTIILAAAINAVVTKVFIVPAQLLPAGTSAVAVSLQKIIFYYTKINIFYYWIFFAINLPLLTWAWFKLGRNIVMKTAVHVISFTIISLILPNNMELTRNIFINCLSAGVFIGVANIILLYVGASGTGLDLIGLYVNAKKNANIMGKINAVFNASIYIVYIPFASYDKAFLSLATTLINSLITDHFHVNSRYVMLMIVTKKPNLINEYITEKARRGDIMIDSVGGYSLEESKTIFTVISKHKFSETIKHLKSLDENIYTVVVPTQKVIGRMKSKVGVSNL